MGYDEHSASGLIRVTLGRFNTQQQVLQFMKILKNAVTADLEPKSEYELERVLV
jgi:cysteine sulfinate desulfinase/cysteine desulfurase-like protein